MLRAPVNRLSERARSTRFPARNVRLRLTALYGGLFLLCGAGLLAITNALVRHSAALPKPPRGSSIAIQLIPGGAHPPAASSKAGDDAQFGSTGAAATHAAVFHQLLVQSGIALAVMAVAAIGLGWFIAGRVLRPLQTSFDAQRRFVANASHELRTPLTMMRTALDVAIGKPAPPPPEVHALAAKIRRGLDKADQLLESFLVLARADHTAVAQDVTVGLDRTVADALAWHSQAIGDMGLRIERALRPAPVAGSEVLLVRMVNNIIDNAVRHNEPNGWVRVVTTANATSARLIVETGGRLLDEHQVRDLAQPFRRIGAERTGSDNGVGLGLSIVAAVAAAHHGTLHLQARAGGGLRVAVTLPVAAQRVEVGVPA
jgi:signal transduction histidine kinase